MTSDELEHIIDAVIKRGDEKYVSKQECETKNDKIQANIAAMSENMAVVKHTVGTISKWASVIGTALIGAAVSGVIALVVWVIRQMG